MTTSASQCVSTISFTILFHGEISHIDKPNSNVTFKQNFSIHKTLPHTLTHLIIKLVKWLISQFYSHYPWLMLFFLVLVLVLLMLFIIIGTDPCLSTNFSNSLKSTSDGTSFIKFSLILQLDESSHFLWHSIFSKRTCYSDQN